MKASSFNQPRLFWSLFAATIVCGLGYLLAPSSVVAGQPGALPASNFVDSSSRLPGLQAMASSISGVSGFREAQQVEFQLPNPANAHLERVDLGNTRSGGITLTNLPEFQTSYNGQVAGISQRNEFVFYSLNPELQKFAQELVQKVKTAHVAIVAMDPKTGKILAIAEKSNSIKNLSLHAGFPAASLFKLVTATAALEKASLDPDALIHFRGGTYALDRGNYLPSTFRDRRFMPFGEALGRSCNPVFGRIAFKYLNPPTIRSYANAFGFNQDLRSDMPMTESSADIPDDEFEMTRAAAGFGEVFISPIHAAALMSGIANNGKLPRPEIIDKIVSSSGKPIYVSQPAVLNQIARPETTQKLMEMMENTVTSGTSRKEFNINNRPVFPNFEVAAKTGTLKGDNPMGLNNWFIAAAPVGNPQIAVSVIVVDPTHLSAKASHIGRMMFEKFFYGRNMPNATEVNNHSGGRVLHSRGKVIKSKSKTTVKKHSVVHYRSITTKRKTVSSKKK
jgi:peptidoglycan glycosyltransferase